jgi:hypothetical protein
MFERRLMPSRARAACALTALALAAAALAQSAAGASAPGKAEPPVSATLTQCITSVLQAERSATFAGEMSALPGTTRMAMRVDVEERPPHELQFHAVTAPGIGVWRTSEAHVKVFKYLKQVTDLSAPARYRATVRFRWLNAHGATVRRAERHTRVCTQPAAPAPVVEASAPGA